MSNVDGYRFIFCGHVKDLYLDSTLEYVHQNTYRLNLWTDADTWGFLQLCLVSLSLYLIAHPDSRRASAFPAIRRPGCLPSVRVRVRASVSLSCRTVDDWDDESGSVTVACFRPSHLQRIDVLGA